MSGCYRVMRKWRSAACQGPMIAPSSDTPTPPPPPRAASVGFLPLIALIYFETSGGAYGSETIVGAAGPGLAILGLSAGFVVWSVPEALVCAELGTAFPEDRGYVAWVGAAFGPRAAFAEGWLSWCSGVADSAIYPVLLLDYVAGVSPAFKSGAARALGLVLIIVTLSAANARGLKLMGRGVMLAAALSALPFLMLFLVALPDVQPSRWFGAGLGVCPQFGAACAITSGSGQCVASCEQRTLEHVDWRSFLNMLLWNLNYWDSISTLAGEVEQPEKNLPRATGWTMALVLTVYLLPLLAATGAQGDPLTCNAGAGAGAGAGQSVASPHAWQNRSSSAYGTGAGVCASEFTQGFYTTSGVRFGGAPMGWIMVIGMRDRDYLRIPAVNSWSTPLRNLDILMGWIMVIGAVASNCGQFCAELASDTYQVYGMALEGELPAKVNVYEYRDKDPQLQAVTCLSVP